MFGSACCFVRPTLTPSLLPPLVSRRTCTLSAKDRVFLLRESSKKKWRARLVFCFKNDEDKSLLSDNGFESVEIKSDGDLVTPKLDSSEIQSKNWNFVFQKLIELLGQHPKILMSKASITHRGNNLYMQSPPILEEMTRSNLQLPLYELMGKIPSDTVHVSGMAESKGKKTSCLRKLHVVFKGISDGATEMHLGGIG